MLDPKPLQSPDAPPGNDVTSRVQRLVQSDVPIVLSINGQIELRLTNRFARERLVEMLDRLEYIESIQDALDSMDRGEGIPLEDFMRRMSEKHGIPD
ncbi:MAG TPA: hypothetical protein VML55_05015 [Planctomycetaceae bacterium]|nr:hypothetical protein [Planctomycetaceae bacterium]